MTVGNVWLVARSLAVPGQVDSESDYLLSAGQVDGPLRAPPIRLTKPGGTEAALDAAAIQPWVLAHN